MPHRYPAGWGRNPGGCFARLYAAQGADGETGRRQAVNVSRARSREYSGTAAHVSGLRFRTTRVSAKGLLVRLEASERAEAPALRARTRRLDSIVGS
jgi:hypothetical protein